MHTPTPTHPHPTTHIPGGVEDGTGLSPDDLREEPEKCLWEDELRAQKQIILQLKAGMALYEVGRLFIGSTPSTLSTGGSPGSDP